MSYNLSFVGNRLEQFNYIQLDILLQDDENIRPDYRVTKNYPQNTSEIDILKDVINELGKAEQIYQDNLKNNGSIII